MKRSTHLAFAAIILLSFLATQEAKAQWWNTGGGAQSNQKPKRPPPPPLPKDALKNVTLSQAPALAYWPVWTGFKPLFLGGAYYPNMPPIETYLVSWAFKEPAGTVISWYNDALGAQGWVINRTTSRDNMIVAKHSKEPLELQFTVGPSPRPGYRCTGEVRWIKNNSVAAPKSNQRRR
jgi:hypothetical protein